MGIDFFIKFFKFSIEDTGDIEKNENLRKKMMLYLLMFFGVLFLVIMGVRLLIEKNYFYSGINFFVSLLISILFLFVRSGTKLKFYSVLSVLLMQIFFMFLFLSGVSDHMAFVWYYLFPLIAIFLLGIKAGIIFSLLMICLTFFLNTFAGHMDFIVPFKTGSMVRITLSYLAVLLFTYFFEQTRMSTQKKLKEAIAEVNELAIRDGLTGLYNRRYMDEVIQHIVYQWKRADSILGFLMVDIDYFKKYNDTYGHQAGDKLLKTFSGMISSLLRRESDYVFRYGGEEFALLLPSTSHETIDKFAHLIIKRTQSLKISHSTSPLGIVTVSIGAVSLKSSKNRDIEEIVGLADEALYEAKNSGRNKVISKIFNEQL